LTAFQSSTEACGAALRIAAIDPCAERVGRIHQRVDGAVDQFVRRHHHEIGKQFQIARALLDADDQRHLVHDAGQKRRRKIGPRHHVVDDDRHAGFIGHAAEVIDHRLLVRLEQIMHRRHLQRGDIHVAHKLAAPDRVARGVDDDAGDDGCAPPGGFHCRRHQVAILLVVERMPFAGRTTGRHAVAAGANQPVDLGSNQLEIDLAVFPERRGHRRYHAGGTCFHGLALAFPSADSGCVPALPTISAGCGKPMGCRDSFPVAELARQGIGNAA
jgi:hypothetical protein